jgi:hypothetical protein
LRKARSGSAPRPSGIHFKVYKNCPKLLKKLWNLIKIVWRKGTVSYCWKEARGCLTPKEKKSENSSQFRTISFLSVEDKIFFSIVVKRISAFVTENDYVNTAVQKGGISGFSGFLEHTAAITQRSRRQQ